MAAAAAALPVPAAPALPDPTGPSPLTLARWTRAMEPSVLREVMKAASRPDVLSFAVGMPAPELFPAHDLALAAQRVVAGQPETWQYAMPCRELKQEIVRVMEGRGVRCRDEQVFLTTGAQQALGLVAQVLVDPGGRILAEPIVYEGFRMAVGRLGAAILPVPTRPETGLDLDALASLLASGVRPAFLYVIPVGHNPLGNSLSARQRARLLELARRYRIAIVEDDAYGFLSYDGEAAPPLRALEPDHVVYVGSFSKIVAPGLRLGWLVVPDEMVPHLSTLRHAAELDVRNVPQQVLAEYLRGGHLPEHLRRLRRTYRVRRDCMLRSLARHFPSGCRWTRPAAGMFVWVEAPHGINTVSLLREALLAGVAFSPGRAFALAASAYADRCLRLCFSNSTEEQIEQGIARLGRLLRRAS